jgi:hypothetical protein
LKADFDEKTRAHENASMDSDTTDEKGDGSNQGSPDTKAETPQSKLRDLPPDKDPMGAGKRPAGDQRRE